VEKVVEHLVVQLVLVVQGVVVQKVFKLLVQEQLIKDMLVVLEEYGLLEEELAEVEWVL